MPPELPVIFNVGLVLSTQRVCVAVSAVPATNSANTVLVISLVVWVAVQLAMLTTLLYFVVWVKVPGL